MKNVMSVAKASDEVVQRNQKKTKVLHAALSIPAYFAYCALGVVTTQGVAKAQTDVTTEVNEMMAICNNRSVDIDKRLKACDLAKALAEADIDRNAAEISRAFQPFILRMAPQR